MHTIINFYKALNISIKRFFFEEYTYRASALAFTTLLALVPLLAISVFLITLFPFFSGLVMLAENYLLKNFIPTSAASIESYFQGFIQQAAHLPTISIIFLFITAIMLINTIEETFHQIWHAEKKRAAWWAFLFYGLVLLLTPLIIGASVFLSTYFFSLPWITGASQTLGVSAMILLVTPIIVSTLIFTLLYRVMPHAYVPWRHALVGALLAVILLEAMRLGFTFYMTKFPSYTLIYGVFAIIPIFLVWIYLCWCIILWGALVTHSLSIRTNP